MDKKKTETKILKEEVKNIVFPVEEGYIRGNIKDFNYEIVTLDCTEEDINSGINESIVVRPYFEYEEKKMKIPVFFTCIKGVYKDIGEYLKLLDICKSAKNNIFIKNVCELLDKKHVMDGLFKNYKIEDVFNEKINMSINKIKETVGSVFNINKYRYSKYFDKSLNKFNVESIIQSRDKGLIKYSLDMQRHLLNKLNDYLNGYYFVTQIDETEKLKLLECIANLKDEIISKINNFEISNVSPKITLFLDRVNSLSNLDILFLGYLHTLGVDILIFTPGGVSNLELILSKKMFSTLSLESLNNNVSLQMINEINKILKRHKVNVRELDNSLEALGYNAPIRKYEIQINLFKSPILKKLGAIIRGWQLTTIGIVGLIVDVYLMFFSIGDTLIISILLTIIFVILIVITALGIKLLSLDM